MDTDEIKALDLFRELIEEGKGYDYGLEERHLFRGVSIRKISKTVYFIMIERHPHIFGRESLGRASSAYATVQQIFSVDCETKELKLEESEIKSYHIDHYALAEEDFPIESEGVDLHLSEDDKLKLGRLRSETKVRFVAKEMFKKLGFESINKDIYFPDMEDLPVDFLDKILEAQEEVFINGVVDNWKSGKYKRKNWMR